MTSQIRMMAMGAALALLFGCSPYAGELLDAETTLETVLKSPEYGARELSEDYPTVMSAVKLEYIHNAYESGEYDKGPSTILAALKEGAKLAPGDYLSVAADATARCEEHNGDGHWEASLGVSLHEFCVGAGDLVAIVHEKKDHPDYF